MSSTNIHIVEASEDLTEIVYILRQIKGIGGVGIDIKIWMWGPGWEETEARSISQTDGAQSLRTMKRGVCGGSRRTEVE